jgi:hypothetical protein
MAAADDFPTARTAPFHRETKSPAFAILRWRFGPLAALGVQVRPA